MTRKALIKKVIEALKSCDKPIGLQALGKLTNQEVIIKDVTDELRDAVRDLVEEDKIFFDKNFDMYLKSS